MMKKNTFFVDAESDGLYGKFLSVAVLVTDMAKEVFSSELKLIESIKKAKIPMESLLFWSE